MIVSAVLLFAVVFGLGFGAGYAVRAYASHRRRTQESTSSHW